MIDSRFIDRWRKHYANEGQDYADYKNLIKLFNGLKSKLSNNDIIGMVDWKSSRIKGKMSSPLNKYIDAILDLPQIHTVEDRMIRLISLDGWHVAMASTALHFVYPETVPIIDFRVLEVLQKYESFTATRDSIIGFMKYYHRINEIRYRTKRSIRQIDEALWTYHRINMS